MTDFTRWTGARPAGRAEHLALITPEFTWTYARLDQRARSLACKLRTLGVRSGDRVAVLLGNDPLLVELLHALPGLEATLIPLNTRLLAGELRELLEDSGSTLLISSAEYAQSASLAAREVDGLIAIDAQSLHSTIETPGPFCDAPDPSMDQAILFTSGTTGRSKGVRLSLANQLASAKASAERLGVCEDDRWLCAMPLYHVGGLAIALRSAIYGTTMLLHERFEAEAVARALAEDRVRIVSLVPTMLQRVLEIDSGFETPPALRVVLLGGGPIPAPLLATCRERGIPVAPTYGLTEAASQVATLAPSEGDPSESAGRALPGVEIQIVDDEGKELPPDTAGEIRVRGPQVMSGYLDRPDANARVLREGWLYTGDVGMLDRSRFLSVLERRTDLIVSGGENVYPAEVESVLLKHPQVREVGVIARADPHWGQRVHAVVVLRDRASFDSSELERWARARLAAFKVPRSFEVATELPRTASGKLRRRELRRRQDQSI
ncbi:MAG: o-succinylbenzoate--CoA ligase [bacterium]|nr:o-succinylbenzoate--CoA ligase [bacterium]